MLEKILFRDVHDVEYLSHLEQLVSSGQPDAFNELTESYANMDNDTFGAHVGDYFTNAQWKNVGKCFRRATPDADMLTLFGSMTTEQQALVASTYTRIKDELS